MTTSSVFNISNYVITIWHSNLHVLKSEIIQSKSALNQNCSVLETQCFRAKKIALNSADSELILFETELNFSVLISADVFHVPWISIEKRQTSETALFSADYLWDLNSGGKAKPKCVSQLPFQPHQYLDGWYLRNYSLTASECLTSKYHKTLQTRSVCNKYCDVPNLCFYRKRTTHRSKSAFLLNARRNSSLGFHPEDETLRLNDPSMEINGFPVIVCEFIQFYFCNEDLWCWDCSPSEKLQWMLPWA